MLIDKTEVKANVAAHNQQSQRPPPPLSLVLSLGGGGDADISGGAPRSRNQYCGGAIQRSQEGLRTTSGAWEY